MEAKRNRFFFNLLLLPKGLVGKRWPHVRPPGPRCFNPQHLKGWEFESLRAYAVNGLNNGFYGSGGSAGPVHSRTR